MIIILMEFKEALAYLESALTSLEDNAFCKTILINLIANVLENQELSGEQDELFTDAVNSLINIGVDQHKAFEICTKAQDLVIFEVVTHIPDYDHKKYSNNSLTFSISDECKATINYTPTNTE